MSDTRFGRYQVESQIGQGSMGRVYRAYDPLTHRTVAIKAIREEILAEEHFDHYLMRFRREAQAAGRLNHPNVVTVFDVGEDFFVMEYLEGRTLSQLLAERGTFPLDEALSIAAPLADALAYAHARGVFHRDIKPANIVMVAGGVPKLADFGVAHLESAVITGAGCFLGSPSYMAPEQISSDQTSASSDLYSLFVVTYEMLTGHRPFPSDSIDGVLYKVVHADPAPPTEWNDALPREYDAVFRRALAKHPENRFHTFEHFAAALRSADCDDALVDSGAETIADPASANASFSLTSDLARGSSSSRTIAKRTRLVPVERLLAGATALLGAAALASIGIATVWSGRHYPGPEVHTDPPGAAVTVDELFVGESPVELGLLREGRHVLKLEKAGYLPLEEVFEVRSPGFDGPLMRTLRPAKATLFLESTPETARVRVNGASLVNSPIDGLLLEPGEHEILVEREGYEPWSSVVAARAGESLHLVARLQAVRSRPRPDEPTATARAKPPEKPEYGQLVELGPDDQPPERLSGSPTGYPPEARKLEQQGRVTVEFIVTENGVPIDVRVLESASPHLDQAVVEAVKTWRYSPAIKDGVPVRVKMQFRQTFWLGS